jgi:CheY-like chemotaxis protein
MSADAFTEEIKISQSAGMNEYITKPIRRQELYRVLDKWINLKGK